MSAKTDKLRITKLLCRLGILLVWLVAAANIIFYLQSSVENGADSTASAEVSTGQNLSDLFSVDHLMSSDASIQLGNLVISGTIFYIAFTVLMALLAIALLAMAIGIIDMRNLQARRSRH